MSDETTKIENGDTTTIEIAKTEIPAQQRLVALTRTARILSDTIRGLSIGEGNAEAAQPLIDQLVAVTKRITWIEKSNDPDYKPLDPQDPRRIRNGRKFAKKSG